MPAPEVLRVVVASPSDVQSERARLDQVVEEVNQGVARDRDLLLELVKWEKDAFPGFHPAGPQGLIDTVLRIEECDLFIGIFWRRFGTATADALAQRLDLVRRLLTKWHARRERRVRRQDRAPFGIGSDRRRGRG